MYNKNTKIIINQWSWSSLSCNPELKWSMIIDVFTRKTGNDHCVKSVQIRSYFWYLFSHIRSEYGERYFVSLRIHSKCGKIRTRNNSVFGHFSRNGFCQSKLKREKKTAGTTFQQLLAWFINSHWLNSSTVTGTILQQSLARLFNSSELCATVNGKIVQ